MATTSPLASASNNMAPPEDAVLESSETKVPGGTSKKDLLYDKCAEAPLDTIFYQRELANMQIAENTTALLDLLQQLVDSHMMKTLTWENQLCWKLRTREDAAKLRSMTPDERQIYLCIDEMQAAGIWSRTLRTRTGIAQNIMTKCLKVLEGRGLIKSVTNVKFPTRKMYLLSHLIPSDDIAGGPWHSEGAFDVGLIDTIARVIVQYVEQQAWVSVPSNPRRSKHLDSAIAKKKAQAQATRDIEDIPKITPYPRGEKTHLVPQDSGFNSYPTVTSILGYINNLGLLKNIIIQEADLEQLLEMMVLDGRLERMGARAYRTVRGAKERDEDERGFENGFNDAPCGNCPVFEICGDDGPISAKNCAYFTEWLGRER